VLDDVGDLGAADSVEFLDGAKEFLRDPFGGFALVEVDFDFEVDVNAGHVTDDTISTLVRAMKPKPVCPICEVRAPRRFCPAQREEICAKCCGEGREETINCPLECEYLREARLHEKLPPFDAAALPHAEIELTEAFLERHQELAIVVGRLLLVAAMNVQGAVDPDLRETLDALVRTYKNAANGLIYESRPANLVAAAVQDRFQQELGQFRQMVAERQNGITIPDRDLLGVLAFWQRMELQRSNGRRKGRAFIESLFALMPPPAETEAGVVV
jgi:hypothetical protein